MLDWQLTLASVTDGDTIRAHLTREIPVVNGWASTLHTTHARGLPLRLIILDTPELGNERWSEARADLRMWLDAYPGQLRAETYETAGWDRLLADVYVEGDRGNTATQWMLRRGWDAYLR